MLKRLLITGLIPLLFSGTVMACMPTYEWKPEEQIEKTCEHDVRYMHNDERCIPPEVIEEEPLEETPVVPVIVPVEVTEPTPLQVMVPTVEKDGYSWGK